MEKETKEYTPRTRRIESRPTASRQRIPFVDNRPVNLRSPIQLGKKKYDPRNPYDQEMSEDNILMGREVECTTVGVRCLDGKKPKNGTVYARSAIDPATSLPLIELQSEGGDRGTCIVEVVFGPVKGSFYVSDRFYRVRHLLYQVLEAAADTGLPLAVAINLFNIALGSNDEACVLVATKAAAGMQLYRAGGSSESRDLQLNLSLPLTLLSADNPEKPMMEDLYGASRATEAGVLVDIRTAVNAEFKEFTPEARSAMILLLHNMFMEPVRDKEVVKHKFSVLVKASPADIVFTRVEDAEVGALIAARPRLVKLTLGLENQWSKSSEAFRLPARSMAYIDRFALMLRQRLQLGSRVPGKAVGDYAEGYSVVETSDGQEQVFHDMPRASGRIPGQLTEGRAVFELRRAGHFLNQTEDNPPTPFDYLWNDQRMPPKHKALDIDMKKKIRDSQQQYEQIINALAGWESFLPEMIAKRKQLEEMRELSEKAISEMRKELADKRERMMEQLADTERELSDNMKEWEKYRLAINPLEEKAQALADRCAVLEEELRKATQVRVRVPLKEQRMPQQIKRDIQDTQELIDNLEKIMGKSRKRQTLVKETQPIIKVPKLPGQPGKGHLPKAPVAIKKPLVKAPAAPKEKSDDDMEKQLCAERSKLEGFTQELRNAEQAAASKAVEKRPGAGFVDELAVVKRELAITQGQIRSELAKESNVLKIKDFILLRRDGWRKNQERLEQEMELRVRAFEKEQAEMNRDWVELAKRGQKTDWEIKRVLDDLLDDLSPIRRNPFFTEYSLLETQQRLQVLQKELGRLM